MIIPKVNPKVPCKALKGLKKGAHLKGPLVSRKVLACMAGLIRKEDKSIEAFLVKSLWEKFSQYGLLSQKRGLELDKC